MEMNQVHTIANALTQQYVGSDAVLNADLSNVVDIGKAVMDLQHLDHYVASLIDQVGRFVFVNRTYVGKTPSIMMDAWEYGAVKEKITYEGLPTAEANDTWNLQNGVSYDPNIFYKPTVSAKFYSKQNTYDIPMSFAQRQVKSAFQSATQLNAFFSMIENAIQKSMTVKMDQLAEIAINNMIALTLNSANGNRAINLLAGYNTDMSPATTLTAAKAITDPGFIRYASFIMGLYAERLQRLSVLFNIGGKDRFTPPDKLHIILLSEFASAARVYLQSDVYHDAFVALPKAETVPYWQGSGTDYSFMSTSKINVKAAADTTVNVEQTGILGVMFDRDALGVSNLERRVTTNWNARAEFFNNWYKFEAGYFNDTNENFIVFYVADAS